MQVILSHSGKQHAYQVALGLKKNNSLARFYTSAYVRNARLQKYFKAKGSTYWTRRFIEGLSGTDVNANWRFELKEVFLRALYGKAPVVQQAVYQRDVLFDRYVATKLQREQADIFWGFQGSCRSSLAAAKRSGKLAVCELATAHVTEAKKILGEEAKLHPEWANTIDNLSFEPMYEQRLEEEPNVADSVIAASLFTKQSLINNGIPAKKIEVLPLGFNPAHIPYTVSAPNFGKRPLRLLYAGTVTQRKGIKYLLEAMGQFKPNDVELHIIGGIQGDGKALQVYKGRYIYHLPVSQIEMFQQYNAYDALVLPTIFEGFGLVIVEAMAAGLPVVTTAHSIGPDVIEHGHNGYLVPIRDSHALAQAIATINNLPAAKYAQMRQAARQAALRFTWQHYSDKLGQVLQQVSAPKL